MIDKGLCDLGMVHRTKFDVYPEDRKGNTRYFVSLCGLWLDPKKLLEEGTVTCIECISAPPGCR